jgi:hypothetical protein
VDVDEEILFDDWVGVVLNLDPSAFQAAEELLFDGQARGRDVWRLNVQRSGARGAVATSRIRQTRRALKSTRRQRVPGPCGAATCLWCTAPGVCAGTW